jgi:hypothetical protein
MLIRGSGIGSGYFSELFLNMNGPISFKLARLDSRLTHETLYLCAPIQSFLLLDGIGAPQVGIGAWRKCPFECTWTTNFKSRILSGGGHENFSRRP